MTIPIVIVVGVLRSISASQVFREYPELKKYLRKQTFREYRYFSRTVGDAVLAALVQHDIRYHQHEEHEAKELKGTSKNRSFPGLRRQPRAEILIYSPMYWGFVRVVSLHSQKNTGV